MTMAAKDESLYWAAQSGDDKQVQLLVDQGARLEYTNYWGQSAAHQASIYGYLKVLQCLIKAGININETDNVGWNCAHFASANGHVDVIKYLIQLGINLQETNNKGDNCLHCACYWGYLEVIKLLQGLSLESPTNKDGKTPLDYLKEKSKYDDNVTKRRQECLKALKIVIKDTGDTESIKKPPEPDNVPDATAPESIILQRRPKPSDAYKLTKCSSSEWYDIGRTLGISRNYRKQLQKNSMSDDDRLEEVLHKWVESEIVPVTWSNLIEALEGIELKGVARAIKEFLKTSEAIESYTTRS